MAEEKTGQIVWHDLFVADRDRAMAFYGQVAGWTFQVEHAKDFAWGGGQEDFVLALMGNEAGAGFAVTPTGMQNGWIPYVEVRDVDAATKQAVELGGTAVRQPFEVPGVGRNALLRDPCGTLIGISLSRHSFPIPRRQFGPEVYHSGAAFPDAFYTKLFGWVLQNGDGAADLSLGPTGPTVAQVALPLLPTGSDTRWLPSLKVNGRSEAGHTADAEGADVIAPLDGAYPDGMLLVRDSQESCFFLMGSEQQ